MIKTGMTVREAAYRWVNEFNAIPQGMIKKLMECDEDREDWREVTMPTVGDRVYIYDESASGEIVKCDKKTGEYRVKLDVSDRKSWFDGDEFEVENDTRLPMWGTMWSFSNPWDSHWLEEGEGIKVLSDCGFRVYQSDEFGYFFGIDGAGYDFYEQHWIPLYKVRRLEVARPENRGGGMRLRNADYILLKNIRAFLEKSGRDDLAIPLAEILDRFEQKRKKAKAADD